MHLGMVRLKTGCTNGAEVMQVLASGGVGRRGTQTYLNMLKLG